MSGPGRWCSFLLFGTLASPPVLAAPSFDCKLAHSPVERLICADDDLAAMDRDQVMRYDSLRRAASPTGAARLLTRQRAWLASREDCMKGSDRDEQVACLTRVYQDLGTAVEAKFRQSGGLMLEYRDSVRCIHRLRVTESESHPWLTGTPEMAVRLGKLCGDGAGVWLRMRQAHDLWQAERDLAETIKKIPTLRAA